MPPVKQCAQCGGDFIATARRRLFCDRDCARPYAREAIREIARRTRVMRFWEKVQKGPDNECWEWIGYRRQGYGVVGVDREVIGAHRFSFELTNGPIPDGMFVLHRCDNPPCVNPAHLFLGTHADNMADCKVKGRAKGSPLVGSDCHAAKLNEALVMEIRNSQDNSVILADRYRVSATTIRHIKTRNTWRHI